MVVTENKTFEIDLTRTFFYSNRYYYFYTRRNSKLIVKVGDQEWGSDSREHIPFAYGGVFPHGSNVEFKTRR